MEQKENVLDKIIVDDPNKKIYNAPVKTVPKPQQNIGIDTDNTLFQNIVGAGESSHLDISQVEAFSQVSRSRDQMYSLLDTMGEDGIISAVLETHAEDATEYNTEGRSVWVTSQNNDVATYITYLLDSMNIDKNIYKWAYSLCKYGDLYLRLYRESEFTDDLFGNPRKPLKEGLDEDVKIRAYSKHDRYAHYVEAVSNPAEIFELTRFGKTYGYVKANLSTIATQSKGFGAYDSFYQYRFKKNDVEIYPATEFVHACLEDSTSRTPEKVDIFLEDDTEESGQHSYTVRRGQSLLYTVFRIWREMMLLENSLLLNRITKSSILRVIGVEVGDMPKENVVPHISSIKHLIEQKAALNEGKSFAEYTNPGPIENNIYVPTKNGVGAITTQQIGGDVDIKSLADLEYFKNKFFGALRVPKQFFSETDDSTGFNGGTSLSIISSRYAKMIKRIQNTLIQALTDAINLMLIDKGLNTYVNNFQICMQHPATQEEIDRRDASASKVSIINDIMNILSDLDNKVAKLKILKAMLSNVITDNEVINILQEQIDLLELNEAEGEMESDMNEPNFNLQTGNEIMNKPTSLDRQDNPAIPKGESGIDMTEEEEEDDDNPLPTPDELGIDMTDNTLEI